MVDGEPAENIFRLVFRGELVLPVTPKYQFEGNRIIDSDISKDISVPTEGNDLKPYMSFGM